MIEILDAKQADLDYCRQNTIDGAIKEYPQKLIDGFSKTAFVDGEPIAIGGLVIYWPGVGESWLILSKKANDHKTEITRCIRRIVKQFVTENKLHRLQVNVRTDFPQARKLVEHLGFVYEGTLKRYTPNGVDCWMFAKTRKVQI
jgi:RimJ/RimL family protein N-acetyltransferase